MEPLSSKVIQIEVIAGLNSASIIVYVEEIEQAIDRLSPAELAEIRAWLWDRDIERDSTAGRLDHLAEEALDEYRSGKARRL